MVCQNPKWHHEMTANIWQIIQNSNDYVKLIEELLEEIDLDPTFKTGNFVEVFNCDHETLQGFWKQQAEYETIDPNSTFFYPMLQRETEFTLHASIYNRHPNRQVFDNVVSVG